MFEAFGVNKESVQAMLVAIEEMVFFLRTAFGDSKNSAGTKIRIKTQGLCQGNGTAPAGWAVISITVLGAHKRKGNGAKIVCPISNGADIWQQYSTWTMQMFYTLTWRPTNPSKIRISHCRKVYRTGATF